MKRCPSLRTALWAMATVALVACSGADDDASSTYAAADPARGGGGYGGSSYGGGSYGGGSNGNSGGSTHMDGGVSTQGGAAGAGGNTSGGGGTGAAMDAAAADAMTDAAEPPDAKAEAAVAQDAGDMCASLDSSKPLILYQSADDSNSMASPVIVRRLIQTGQNIPIGVVRTYEFLNYYRITFPYPEHGRVGIVPQMAAGDSGEYTLQIGVQSEKAAKPRRPMNITFVLDTSGSMTGTPLSLEQAAVRAIAGSTQAGDIASMVIWSDTQAVLMDNHIVSGPNDSELVAKANALVTNGSTNLSAGLVLGYQLAKKNYQPSWMNRVVIVSDGQANTGITDDQLIANESHAADGEGIYLVGVGVGDGVNDTLMNTVTDKGRGAYVYLDSEQEAQTIFGPRFDETMEVAVRDIRLELTLPWYFMLKSTSAEQTSTNPAAVDPQYLAPNDAIIFNNTLVPCSASQVNPNDQIRARVTYSRPLTHEAGEDFVNCTVSGLMGGTTTELKKGSAVVAYAEGLKPKSSYAENAALLNKALALADVADPDHVDYELNEIRSLIAMVLK